MPAWVKSKKVIGSQDVVERLVTVHTSSSNVSKDQSFLGIFNIVPETDAFEKTTVCIFYNLAQLNHLGGKCSRRVEVLHLCHFN
jgi:hypothetical protein